MTSSRNGHPEWVYNAVKDSIHPETQLILNADDPLVSCFGYGRDNVVWFGAGNLPTDTKEFVGVYNDGAYCPHCKSPMTYSAITTTTSATMNALTAVLKGRIQATQLHLPILKKAKLQSTISTRLNLRSNRFIMFTICLRHYRCVNHRC